MMIFLYVQGYSQTAKDFVYKKVNGNDIQAGVFP